MSFFPNAQAGNTGEPRSALDARYEPRFPKIAWTIPPQLAYTVSTIGTNGAIGGRVVWPETGIINALGVFVRVQSGNLDIGVYDTSATTRNRLVSTGSTAVAAANTYQTIAVNLPVTAGVSADLMLGCDNGTASFATNTPIDNAQMVLPSGWMTRRSTRRGTTGIRSTRPSSIGTSCSGRPARPSPRATLIGA